MFIRENDIKPCGAYDTVVCGGGIAGIAAALSASRCGARVLLLEREYALGGLATLGLVTIYLPLCDGKGRQVSFSIAEELLPLCIGDGFEGEKQAKAWLNREGSLTDRISERFEVQFNPNIFAIRAEQLLLKSGVKIIYGADICSVQTEKGRITHIIYNGKSGLKAVESKTVVDATGDALVANISGETTVKFSQGNIPAAWYYTSVNGKNSLKMLGFCDIPDSHKTDEQKQNDSRGKRYSGIDENEISELMFYSHDMLLKDFLKGGMNSASHSLSSVASIPQLRMTRRIDGVYTQDEDEMHREYDDSVGLIADWRKPGPVYEIPFSCLKGRKISNLLAAGRCVSSTDAMWDITRVIPACAVTGQAAGTAAALFDSFENSDIMLLQEKLKASGVIIHEKELKRGYRK